MSHKSDGDYPIKVNEVSCRNYSSLKSLPHEGAMGTPFIGGGLPYLSQKPAAYVVPFLNSNDAHTVLF